MPVLSRPEAELHYEEFGAGYPVLLFAPGGVRSQISRWREQASGEPVEWLDPTTALAGRFRLIAMDQRNAGQSRAPLTGREGWQSYAADHLALLDHLGIGRCHLMGGCIGASFALRLCQIAPERVAAAVLMNPIGADGIAELGLRRQCLAWGAALRQSRPEIDPAVIAAYAGNLYGGDFVFSVTRDFVAACRTPLLLLPGNDEPHPRVISDEIAALAPDIEIVEDWKGREQYDKQRDRILAFLLAHTPG